VSVLISVPLISLIANNGSGRCSDSAADERSATRMPARAADQGSGARAYPAANECAFLRLRRTTLEHQRRGRNSYYGQGQN
jgi:hypothetical protein